MFLKKSAIGVCVIAVLSLSPIASAELQSTDWLNEGDSLATLDTLTGIEWLDFSYTKGKSRLWLESNLQAGGELEGWRLPTNDEVYQLLESSFTPLDNHDTGTFYYVPQDEAVSFLTLMDNGTTGASYFYYDLKRRSEGPYARTRSVHGDVRNRYNSNYDYVQKEKVAWEEQQTNPQLFNYMVVNDGGITLSSKRDPTLNARNQSAPINNVSTLFTGMMASFGLLALRRRKPKAV
jgi:hypothetical protein